ncbi:MAG: hypothetical protein MUC95_08760 [Spirochaetes bacterium]|jgi:uncharacterized protein YcbK (DUF882 family)|nr:hypothetical protein [Spirochaetota bacterium]
MEKKKKGESDNPEKERDKSENIDVKKMIITDEIIELLNSDNISKAIKSYKSDTEEKKTALEFVTSHVQFITELVAKDRQNNLQRMDIEIKDVVANVNSMLRARDELIFTSMVLKCTAHYRQIQSETLKNDGD